MCKVEFGGVFYEVNYHWSDCVDRQNSNKSLPGTVDLYIDQLTAICFMFEYDKSCVSAMA